MINKIDNTKTYNPAFGTAINEINKLPKYVTKNKDIAPVLEGLRQSYGALKRNGQLDALDIKFKLKSISNSDLKSIVVTLKRYLPLKQLFRRISSEKEIKLFVYSEKNNKAILTSNFYKDLAKIRDEQQILPKQKTSSKILKTTDKKLSANEKLAIAYLQIKTEQERVAKAHSKDFLPTVYKVEFKPAKTVKLKDIDPAWKTHTDVHMDFKTINQTFKQISQKLDNGLLEAGCTIRKDPNNKEISQMVLNLNLYSAALDKKNNRLKESDKLILFSFNKELEVVKKFYLNSEDLTTQINERYRGLKEHLDAKIITA